MKRLFSTFLLIIMWLVAVQPTLVFHYCGKTFHSVGLSENHSEHCCGGDCCSDYTVSMATDDFQLAQSPVIDFNSALTIPFLFILPDNLFQWSEIITPSILQHIFPPGGLARQSLDLLAFICILRI